MARGQGECKQSDDVVAHSGGLEGAIRHPAGLQRFLDGGQQQVVRLARGAPISEPGPVACVREEGIRPVAATSPNAATGSPMICVDQGRAATACPGSEPSLK
jgi:hypothetical protein